MGGESQGKARPKFKNWKFSHSYTARFNDLNNIFGVQERLLFKWLVNNVK